MTSRIGFAWMLLILFGAGRLASQEATQIQAQDKTWIEARIRAQETPQATPGSTQQPSLKPNPLETLRNFEPATDEAYRLGKGDEITADFAGRPEMLVKMIVGPDGCITLPLADDVMLFGITRSEAAKAIESALASYYTNFAVQITVTKYTANRVLLLGAVDHPGMFTFDGTPTLLEVLARGGVEAGPNQSGQTPEINQVPERCAIYRDSDQVVWVELRAMMEAGNALADLRLRRDDVVYVPSINERFVSVLGEVLHPGAIPLAYYSTLASILAQAGGLTDHTGNNPHLQVVDPASGSSHMVSLKDLLNPAKSMEVTLKPGEIIFAPKSVFYTGTYVLERLSPLVTVATLAFYAGVL
ncbi:MAG TPA: polysaccharide biosynthesis/export family protein [Terracidiphilus sp.]|nr:polysaccharide biosynthesis/export family protein [Terracidiphilus sp.]